MQLEQQLSQFKQTFSKITEMEVLDNVLLSVSQLSQSKDPENFDPHKLEVVDVINYVKKAKREFREQLK